MSEKVRAENRPDFSHTVQSCGRIVHKFMVLFEYEIEKQIGICKGGFTMKKIGLGIAILLFAIIISLCSSGMGLLVIGIGIVGLIFSIIGFMECK